MHTAVVIVQNCADFSRARLQLKFERATRIGKQTASFPDHWMIGGQTIVLVGEDFVRFREGP